MEERWFSLRKRFEVDLGKFHRRRVVGERRRRRRRRRWEEGEVVFLLVEIEVEVGRERMDERVERGEQVLLLEVVVGVVELLLDEVAMVVVVDKVKGFWK